MKTITLIEESPISNVELIEGNNSDLFYRFSAILQTVDTVNNNRRIYPSSVLSEEIYTLRPKLKQFDLLGELDHPFIQSKDPAIVMRRQHIVMYDRSSHKINDLHMEGNSVIGSLQTLRTEKGKTLAGLIESGVRIGFSLRAFGNLKPRPGGVFEVAKPFKIITWDAVSNPSHSDARLIEITEDVIKEVIYQSALLEGVAMERMDILMDLIDDYSFMEDRQLLDMINKHFNILHELTTANLKEI